MFEKTLRLGHFVEPHENAREPGGCVEVAIPQGGIQLSFLARGSDRVCRVYRVYGVCGLTGFVGVYSVCGVYGGFMGKKGLWRLQASLNRDARCARPSFQSRV